MVNEMLSFILNGEKCIRCGKTCYGMPVCRDCRILLQEFAIRSDVERCSICGRRLLSEFKICTFCRKSHILEICDDVMPIFTYRIWNKNLLFEWKMNGNRLLTDFFVRVVYEVLCREFSRLNIPLIVPVPPRKGKIRKLGWDQVEDICFHLHGKYGLKIFHILERLDSGQQKKNGRAERLSHSERFKVCTCFSQKNKYSVVPDEVLLIDDVITTGATVAECTRVLKRFGVRKVRVLSLFIVD